MYCPYCGAEISDDAGFCVKCGRPVIRPDAGMPQYRKAPAKGKKTWIIAVSVLAVILAAGIFFLFRAHNKSDYLPYNKILTDRQADEFALYDVDQDGSLELITHVTREEKNGAPGIWYNYISIYDIQNGSVIRTLDETGGRSVAVLNGKPYLGVFDRIMENPVWTLYDCSGDIREIYAYASEADEGDNISEPGAREVLENIIKSGNKLVFVKNNSDSRAKYIGKGIPTGSKGIAERDKVLKSFHGSGNTGW